eukprot:g1141.t1
MGKKMLQATRKDKRTREDAASKIQKFVRAWLALLHLRKYLASIVFVQKLTRGRNARIKIWKDEYYHKFHESVWSIVPEAKRLSRILQICSVLRKLEREVVDDAVGILSGGVNGLYSLRDFGAETKASTESDRKTVARFHQLHFAFQTRLAVKKIMLLMRRNREEAKRNAQIRAKQHNMALQHEKLEKARIAEQHEKTRMENLVANEKERKRLEKREILLRRRREKRRVEEMKEQARKELEMKEMEEQRIEIENQKRMSALSIKERIERDARARKNEKSKRIEMQRLRRLKKEEARILAEQEEEKRRALNKALGISPKIPKTRRIKEEAVKRYWNRHEGKDAIDLLEM